MLDKLNGSFTVVREEHYLNVDSSIVYYITGRLTSSKLEHVWKQSFPISVIIIKNYATQACSIKSVLFKFLKII